jgi:hypothetical protein
MNNSKDRMDTYSIVISLSSLREHLSKDGIRNIGE